MRNNYKLIDDVKIMKMSNYTNTGRWRTIEKLWSVPKQYFDITYCTPQEEAFFNCANLKLFTYCRNTWRGIINELHNGSEPCDNLENTYFIIIMSENLNRSNISIYEYSMNSYITGIEEIMFHNAVNPRLSSTLSNQHFGPIILSNRLFCPIICRLIIIQ